MFFYIFIIVLETVKHGIYLLLNTQNEKKYI